MKSWIWFYSLAIAFICKPALGATISVDTEKYFAYLQQPGLSITIFLSKQACQDKNKASQGWQQSEYVHRSGGGQMMCWKEEQAGTISNCLFAEPGVLHASQCNYFYKVQFLSTENLPRPPRFDKPAAPSYVPPVVSEPARFAPWTLYDGKTGEGTPVCGIYTSHSDGSKIRNIGIKKLKGSQEIVVTLSNDRWAFKGKVQTDLILDFDDNEPLRIPAVAYGKLVDAILPQPHFVAFFSLLKEKQKIRFRVDSAEKKFWSVPLVDITAPLKEFYECMRAQDK